MKAKMQTKVIFRNLRGYPENETWTLRRGEKGTGKVLKSVVNVCPQSSESVWAAVRIMDEFAQQNDIVIVWDEE